MEIKPVDEKSLTLKKLHPSWIGFKLFKSMRSLILFIIFVFMVLDISSNSIFSIYGFSLIGLFIVYQIGTTILEWKHFTYYLNGEELFINKGKFVTMKRYFPLENIQGINQNTSFFHRLLGLTSLLIDVGSSDKNTSIKLEMISLKEASNIKKTLSEFGNINVSKEEYTEEISDEELKGNSLDKNIHYEIELSEILIASLTSLRLLFFLTVLYTIYSELSQFFSIEEHVNKILNYFQSSVTMLSVGIVLLLVCSMVYGVLKTYLQYGGLKVTSDPYRIYIEKGKGSKTNFSIPKDKIQALSINSGFIHKVLNIVNVKLISSIDTDDQDVKASNVLFPFIERSKAFKLIPEVIPTIELSKNIVNIPKQSLFVKLLRTTYAWLLFPLVIYYFIPGFWYIALLIFVFTITSQILSGLFSGYALNESFLQLKKGSIATRMFVTKRDKIERLMMSQSMIQRKMGLASLKVTIRSRPTKVITIHDIPLQIALQCQSWYIEGKNFSTELTIPNKLQNNTNLYH
ncbi:PH domain-containing protein [Oceanobacillus chungangensis]|uniref:YdbS-like PH domain-containing protein n=1 Tax=Oceanobacillus chungangensis TaxID=1229152 RepID=A0A3D8PKH8_9BACI|nr:PH domain-containing protein [Oceanobacillus chungangensis]RDW16172.1 hypothetical protein CWR45_14940 [Oceanobacillus chungangensis]